MARGNELNPKQARFVEEYLLDLNAKQAAIRSGYAVGSAEVTGSKLLSNAKVRARVDEAMAARSVRTGVNQDRIVRELARIAFANAPDVINAEDATVKSDAAADDTAVIASVRVKIIPGKNGDGIEREIKLHDKTKAIELLGKHLGMFVDRVAVTDDRPTIVDNIPGGGGNG